jgi:hypothetical protein
VHKTLSTLVVLATTDNYGGLCYPGGLLRKPFVLGLVSGLSIAPAGGATKMNIR